MGCYHPIAADPDFDSGLSVNGRVQYKLNGPWSPEYQKLHPWSKKVPCGHCLGCRLDYSRQWADRMMFELASHDGKGIFVTLTYNNDHIPFSIDSETGECFGFSLYKRDLQLFFKRLRRSFAPRQISFYASGEYGGQTSRPHYHAIIFGLSLCDFPDCVKVLSNELGQDHFRSDKFARIWSDGDYMYKRRAYVKSLGLNIKDFDFHFPFPDPEMERDYLKTIEIGFHTLSNISYQTCAYTARYTMKKVFAESVKDVAPEFSVMSRNPGIGRTYLDQHPEIYDFSKKYFSTPGGFVEVNIPRYFFYRLKLTNPEFYEKISTWRSDLAFDRELLQLQQTDLSYIEQKELEEQELFNKSKILFKRREVFNDETCCE